MGVALGAFLFPLQQKSLLKKPRIETIHRSPRELTINNKYFGKITVKKCQLTWIAIDSVN